MTDLKVNKSSDPEVLLSNLTASQSVLSEHRRCTSEPIYGELQQH